jgi:hypothetical protein
MKVKYVLWRDGIRAEFASEAEACAYLGVVRGTVSSDCSRDCKCQGWSISRIIGGFPVRSSGLRTNHLLTPNKTELNYYRYQAKKGAKA